MSGEKNQLERLEEILFEVKRYVKLRVWVDRKIRYIKKWAERW